MKQSDFNRTIERLVGGKFSLPNDLSVFFPTEDGRQDLMYIQDFGLAPHAPVYEKARHAVLAAKIPASQRVLLAGYLDLFLGEYERAAVALKPLCDESPNEYWPHFLHAAAIWLLGDQRRTRDYLPSALTAIEKAVAVDSKQMYAYVIRAGLRRELEDVPGRLEDTERVIKMAPRFVWARTEKAEVLGETGHYRLALKEINSLIKRFPNAAWTWAQRGRLRGISGFYKLALADFEKAVELDATCGPMVAWRGETHRRLGHFTEAVADFDRSIELDPGYRLAHAWRGRVRLLIGDYAGAVKDFNATLKIEPREMLAQTWRGEAWWKSGDYRRAAEDFEAVYPAEPQGFWNARLKTNETQENYFMLDAEGGKRQEHFWADLEAGVRSNDTWAWAFLGRCKVGAGRIEDGMRDLTHALQINPANAYALAWRGEGARRLGAFGRALTDLEASLKLNPDNRWAQAWKAQVLVSTDKSEEGLRCFERALDTPEQRYALAHVWHGEALWNMGREQAAIVALRRAFVLDGKCKQAKAWMTRLNKRKNEVAVTA